MLLRVLLFFLYGASFMFAITTILLIAPYIETKHWPVVSKMQIDRMVSLDYNKTEVYASFEKLRSCDYVGIAWYYGNRKTGFTRAPLELMRSSSDVSSPNRPLGRQSSGPWIVSIPMEEISKNSFVELYHKCTPFWLTRTEFYP